MHDAMKYVRKFVKGKRLLQPPALVYLQTTHQLQATVAAGSGIAGHQFVVGEGRGAAGQGNRQKPEIEAGS